MHTKESFPALLKIPAFPPVANRVMNMLAGEAEIPALVALIEKDPGFAVEILRLANSPAFSGGGVIRTLAQAIAQIGFDKLRSLTITVALRSVMQVALSKPIVRLCWTHSLAVALIAKRYGAEAGCDRNEAYTLGLLHDVGRLGLLAAYPDEYGRLLGETHRSQAELMAAEEALLGLDHCNAGALLAGHWGFSETMREIAASHHDAPGAASSNAMVLIHVACRLADCLGFGAHTSDPESIEGILASARPRLVEAITRDLPDLNVILVKELNELRLC